MLPSSGWGLEGGGNVKMGGIGGMDFNIWFWGGWWLLGGGGLVFLKAMPALSSRQNFLHNFWAEWMLLAGAAAFCEEGIKKSIVLSFFTKIDFFEHYCLQ